MAHELRPHCIVCMKQLQSMTRAQALQKGAASEINGRTYYHCIGRHTAVEILEAIEGKPKGFVKAGWLK